MDVTEFIKLTQPVTIQSQRCIHTYNRNARCRRCMNACPEHSICLNDGVIEVSTCIGCGRCVQQCPLDVFQLDMKAALEGNDGHCALVCAKNDIDDAPVVRTRCLAQFSYLELAMLVQEFGDIALYAPEEACSNCECNWFPEAQHLLMVQNGLKSAAVHVHVFRDKRKLLAFLKAGEENYRRQFMKNLALRSRSEIGKAAEGFVRSYKNAAQENLKMKHMPFEKARSHSMVLHDLLQRAKEVEDMPLHLEKLTVTRCRFCHICEKLCPWEALSIFEEEGRAWLLHHDTLCSRCGLCVDLCPEHAMSWHLGLSVQDIIDPKWRPLIDAKMRICQTCGNSFYDSDSDASVCSICKNK